jgi:hypothetical protein
VLMHMIRLVGGPRHGKTATYGEPLPAVLCFQRCVDGRWETVEYAREPGTLIYRHREKTASPVR